MRPLQQWGPLSPQDRHAEDRRLWRMNAPAILCAAPECTSPARDGHVCSYHQGILYADRTFEALRFLVTATNPDQPTTIRMRIVRAMSATQAKDAFRAELVPERCDHWSMTAERR